MRCRYTFCKIQILTKTRNALCFMFMQRLNINAHFHILYIIIFYPDKNEPLLHVDEIISLV